jgi:SAM-dependent methyltransferase
MDAYDRMRENARWMWSLGHYPLLAERLEPYAQALVAAAGIGPGVRVLDVAAGDGNLAVAAAKRGAAVSACDLTPRMVELGRARSAAAGLAIEWVEADVEDLPFPAGGFDVVASAFGAIFAPRPHLAAEEMFRVVRPRGLVAMANYAEAGVLGRITALASGHLPPPDATVPSPYLWGDAEEVQRRLRGLAEAVDVRKRTGTFEFASVEDGVAFWDRTNPPMAAFRSVLPDDVYQDVVVAGLARLFRELNRADDGRLALDWDYVEVLARAPA